MTELRDNDYCYVCGKNNPEGLHVNFKIDREKKEITGTFTPSRKHQGYEGIVHGGILSSLMDEAMAKLAFSLGIPVMTAEIIVKFKSPASPDQELTVSGRITDESRRMIQAIARVERGPLVIAEATGKLLRTS